MNDNLESPINPRYFTIGELNSVIAGALFLGMFVGGIIIVKWDPPGAWLPVAGAVFSGIGLCGALVRRNMRYELELLKRDNPEEFRRQVRERFKVQD